MGGHYSRNKGKRGEYLLRDSLRLEGYTADRVPSSGAAEGFKGDVKFGKEGKEWLAELKLRREAFKSIYALYDAFQTDGTLAIAHVGPIGGLQCVSIHDTMNSALTGPASYPLQNSYEQKPAWHGKHARALRKLINARSMKGVAHVLVLKDDRKPFLYVRYR